MAAATTPKVLAEPGAVIRLQKEFLLLQRDPEAYVVARPDPEDILDWYYILQGPPQTPYDGGHYFGLIRFPPSYPWKPPALFMYTPSGRFVPNKRLCTTMSDYHPETWSQAWKVSTILVGLLSFMSSSDYQHVGGEEATDAQKTAFANVSMAYNRTHPKFLALYPEYVLATPSLAQPNSSSGASAVRQPMKQAPTEQVASEVNDDERIARELAEQFQAEMQAEEDADAAYAKRLQTGEDL